MARPTFNVRRQFTPAAARAIEAAARWGATPLSDLELPELLLGLLAEEECLAAAILAEHAIAAETVHAAFPGLHELGPNLQRPLSTQTLDALAAAEEQLGHLPTPLAFATEHVLLALVIDTGPVGDWLRQRGLVVESVLGEINRIQGYSGEPLEWDETEPPSEPDTQHFVAPTEMMVETEQPLPPLAPRDPTIPETPRPRAKDVSPPPPAIALPSNTSWLRIVDAAANRAREGLRVVEDYVRFALNDRLLTRELKHLRHKLASALAPLDTTALLGQRDTSGDVGTPLSSAGEERRSDMQAVVTANFKRVQEALRTLEETTKLHAADVARAIKPLRYKSYTLERAVFFNDRSLRRLHDVRLYVLVDAQSSEAAFTQLVTGLVQAGVHALQLRAKELDDRSLLARARLLRKLTAGTSTVCIVNDRPDIALLAGADGVHVGQDELPIAEVRQLVGGGMMIGVSTHSAEQIEAAVLDGADYLGVGPTFPSTTKQFAEFPGLALLEQAARVTRLPSFAIGGITLDNVEQVLHTGICRIAVGAAITAAADPAAAAKAFLEKLAAVRA